MKYFQALVDHISTYIKLILLNFLVAFLTWYALTNGLQLYRGISRFLWKRGTDAEEEADRLDSLRRQQFLYEWSQQEVRRRKEEERGHNEVDIYRSAETLRGMEKENRLAERRALEDELERLSQKMAEQRDEEEQLQFEQQKLSRRIARKREDQEELKDDQKRLSHKMEMMAVFHGRSWDVQSKEAMRKEEEELQRNKEILARGNERRMALEEQGRTAIENERIKEAQEERRKWSKALEEQRGTAIENERTKEAQEERRKVMEAEYRWDGLDWEGPEFGPDDEQDLELGLDGVRTV